MFELLALAIAGGAGVFSHIKTRQFVRRRLRYTDWIEKPGVGLFAGVGAMVVASPVVAMLPLVGAGTAIAIGAGVGTGVALGAKDAKGPPLLDD